MMLLLLTVLMAQVNNASDFQDPNSGNAWVSLENYGEGNYGAKTLSSVDFHGNVTLNGTTVTGDTEVSGQFQATNATLNNLAVNGIVELNNSVINGHAVISGLTVLNNSTVTGDMTVASDQVILRSSKIDNLTIKPSGALSQVVTLSNGSQVSGKIRFEQPGGIVQIDTTSSVADEAILGGSLQRN